MSEHALRVLDDHGLSQPQWAILASTHCYGPLSWNAVIASAAAKLPPDWRLSDVAAALQACLDRDWLQSSPQHPAGFILSSEGRRIKESVGDELRLTAAGVSRAA